MALERVALGQGKEQGMELGRRDVGLEPDGQAWIAGEQIAKRGGRQQERLHLRAGPEVLTGFAPQQAGPAGTAARLEPFNRAQPLTTGFGAEAAQLALEQEQHTIGQHLGAQHRLAKAKAQGLQQGIQAEGQVLWKLVEGGKLA